MAAISSLSSLNILIIFSMKFSSPCSFCSINKALGRGRLRVCRGLSQALAAGSVACGPLPTGPSTAASSGGHSLAQRVSLAAGVCVSLCARCPGVPVCPLSGCPHVLTVRVSPCAHCPGVPMCPLSGCPHVPGVMISPCGHCPGVPVCPLSGCLHVQTLAGGPLRCSWLLASVGPGVSVQRPPLLPSLG